MEWEVPPRGPSGRTSRVKAWASSGYGRVIVFACGSLYFIVSLAAAVNWSLWRHDAARSSANHSDRRKLLAVVVPTHAGDIEDAVAAISSWPVSCSAATLHRMQLVLYYSGGVRDAAWSDEIIEVVAQTGGRCFERTRVIFANLDPKDNVYPKGPSIMFYKIFLDPAIARSFGGYDALAILEWDVVVAHPTSFERLYKAAFFSAEDFWVKGSTLTGAEFHETAVVSEMWHILGHLNGNAIYNNTDPEFNEFVNYTLNRWEYQYPYDVALWATIADFPYSWPLWQRYSSKFVATKLIANVGFNDVNPEAVDKAVSLDTLFIHGSTDGGGSTTNHVVHHNNGRGPIAASDCTSTCGSADAHDVPGMSTVCDASCGSEWSSTGPRFEGHGCGASEPTRFGRACRQCYTSQETALAEDRKLALPGVMGSHPGVHVVMCATGDPPQASGCSDECLEAADAVCDDRCGSGVYGDLNCNWRGLGPTCRFCFEDAFQAHLADEKAKLNGSRVVLCATHEPPVAAWYNSAKESGDVLPGVEGGGAATTQSSLPLQLEAVPEAPKVDMPAPATITYSGDITRGEVCAFLPGYFEFLPETRVSVSSVLHFMPGMRVGIATNPVDFQVFNRTLGHESSVNIVNSSHVQHAALIADKACGAGTRLILYMEIGEILSRSFTAKDTHTPQGDLFVAFTNAEGSQAECSRRATATGILLGFSSPCFTFGTDLILPVEINEQLRDVLRSSQVLQHARAPKIGGEDDADDQLTGILASTAKIHREHASVHTPEVLAALAFARNVDSVTFSNPRQWSVRHMFEAASIWDIPLVKPRFGCNFDPGLSVQGYDLGERVAKEFEAFKLGHKCETGFRAVQPSELNIKSSREFGVDGAPQDMPDLKDFRVSVMYRTFDGDARLFEMSIQTVMEHFPSAHELVAVVLDEDEALFQDIMDRHRASAPFPLRLVTEPAQMDAHLQHKFSKLRADLYTGGDHVMHLDSDAVLLEDITYSHIFHLGKPVLPFRRFRSETFEGRRTSMCWQEGTSYAVGEDVLHEFSMFNTHVYPRAMYAAARQFIQGHHQMSVEDFVSTRRVLCLDPEDMATLPTEDITAMFSVFNFIGAYLWYYLYNTIYWLPADPWDTQPEQWRPDLSKFAWVCRPKGRQYSPDDDAGMTQYVADFRMVQSARQCQMVIDHWIIQKDEAPAARKRIDTSSEEWLVAA